MVLVMTKKKTKKLYTPSDDDILNLIFEKFDEDIKEFFVRI